MVKNENLKGLSILIPAYEEFENLKEIVPKILEVLNQLNTPFEIIIVDKTNSIASEKKYFFEMKDVFYINRNPGNFYGDAIRTGIKKSKFEYLIIMDADGSHDPGFIKKLYENRNLADVIIASRYIIGGGSDNGFILRLMSNFLNKIYSTILGLRVKDFSNSFRLYKTIQLKKINLKCNNFDLVEEILLKLSLNKDFKLHEIPYYFRERKYGKTKRNLFLFMISFTFTLFKLKLLKIKKWKY